MSNSNHRANGKFGPSEKTEVECTVCGEKMLRTPSRARAKKFYCSYECQRNRGSKQKVMKNCPCCKKDFVSYVSEYKIHCSKECYTRIGRKRYKCRFCSKKFIARKAYDDGKNHYCDMKCYTEDRRNELMAPYKNLSRTGLWRQWRKMVFIRDGHRCIKCGSKENLEADHIIPVARLIIEGRIDEIFMVENGRTLCSECHKMTPTWGYRGKVLIENQMKERGVIIDG